MAGLYARIVLEFMSNLFMSSVYVYVCVLGTWLVFVWSVCVYVSSVVGA